jgi:hypothetical protein
MNTEASATTYTCKALSKLYYLDFSRDQNAIIV